MNMLSKSTCKFWRLFVQLMLFMILTVATEEIPLHSNADESHLDGVISNEKRYLAALAKNGRLPKPAYFGKREESDSVAHNKEGNSDEAWVDEKRHVGAFLKSHGKPNFENVLQARRLGPFEKKHSESSESDAEKTGKRNVATLARLGRLNAVRFGRFQPQYFGGGKRVNMYNKEMNDGYQVREDNEVLPLPDDCDNEELQEEKSYNVEDNYVYPNLIPAHQKRYVAALARSGRLPAWHPQRMWWGGKRDPPNAYWLRYRSGARSVDNKNQASQSNARFLKHKNKRCKKSSASDGVEGDVKRNLSMLARKGMLPFRPNIA